MIEEEEVSQFPENEVTHIDDNIFIHKAKWEGCPYRVMLNVDVQYFRVGMDFEELEDAKFTARMLQKALNKIRK